MSQQTQRIDLVVLEAAMRSPAQALKNPQPGDRFRDKHGRIIVIRPLGRGEKRDLALWRKAMRGAEVLHVAE